MKKFDEAATLAMYSSLRNTLSNAMNDSMHAVEEKRKTLVSAYEEARKAAYEYDNIVTMLRNLRNEVEICIDEAECNSRNIYDALFNGVPDERSLFDYCGRCACCGKKLHDNDNFISIDADDVDEYDWNSFDFANPDEDVEIYLCGECIPSYTYYIDEDNDFIVEGDEGIPAAEDVNGANE